MPCMPRDKAQSGGIVFQNRWEEHFGGGGNGNLRPACLAVRSRRQIRQKGEPDSQGHTERTEGKGRVPAGCRAGIPLARPCHRFAFRRGKPEDKACDSDRFQAGKCAVYPGRAEHRSAPEGQPQTDRIAEEAEGRRKLRNGSGA